MYRSSAKRLSAFIVSVGACFFLAGASLLHASEKAQGVSQQPVVSTAVRAGKSGAMRDFKVVLPLNPGPKRAIRNDMPPPKGTARIGRSSIR